MSGEKPASGLKKFWVAIGAVFLIGASYLFWVISVLLLLLFLLVDGIILIVIARFGLSYFATSLIKRHYARLEIFVRAAFLRKLADLTIPLSREDAPLLHEMVEKLASQMGVIAPNSIVMEMGATAWIHLKGFFRGSGSSRLGIGYDLLLGLGLNELEAVIAHEMAHAKLVQRGFSFWLNQSLPRSINLASALFELQLREREGKKPAFSFFASTAELAAKWSCRLIATYSRQNEFEADRAAAQLLGKALFCKTLIKTHQLGILSERLPWRERIAHFQQGKGFDQWLKQELVLEEGSQAQKKMELALTQNLSNRYSTHPSLNDRLIALEQNEESTPSSTSTEPAIKVLTEPGAKVEKLVARLQEVIAAEEKRDTLSLLRFTKKVNRSRHRHLQPLQLLAFLLQMAALAILFLCLGHVLGSEHKIWVISASIGVLGLGIFLFKLGSFRIRFFLPIPPYEELKRSLEIDWTDNKIQSLETKIENEIEEKLDALDKGKHAQVKLLVEEGFQSLARCDFLRANVISRLCLKLNDKSVEASIILAISSGYFFDQQQLNAALNNVLKYTKIKNSLSWGVGWALMLIGEWTQAEAYLLEAVKYQPNEATLWMNLAICQMKRGKLHSAVVNARKACAFQPNNKALNVSLVKMLLECGFVREASTILRLFESDFTTDIEMILCITHLDLLLGHRKTALEWAQYLEQQKANPSDLLELANIFSRMRFDSEAECFYKKVISKDFYPAAHFGLAEVYAREGNDEAALEQLKKSLNMAKRVAQRTATPMHLLQFILSGIASLTPAVPFSTAWIVAFNMMNSPKKSSELNLLVYAQDPKEVEDYIRFLYTTMYPDRQFAPQCFRLRKAEKSMQPDGPVRPGIQGIL